MFIVVECSKVLHSLRLTEQGLKIKRDPLVRKTDFVLFRVIRGSSIVTIKIDPLNTRINTKY